MDDLMKRRHAISVFYRGCVFFYRRFQKIHNVAKIYTLPLPIFGKGIFLSFLQEFRGEMV